MANSGKLNEELRWELEKHKNEKEVLASTQARLRYLLNSNPAVIHTSKPGGDYPATFVSENIRELLGWEPWEFVDEPGFWAEHIHPEDRLRVLAKLSKIFKSDYHVQEYRFKHKDGSYRLIHDELRLVRDAGGEPLEIVGCMLDITESRKEP